MLKAIFGSAKDDPYNQATQHFAKLRNLAQSDPAYAANLIQIIRLCQLAVSQRPADGDAHILLANAYLLASLINPFGESYTYALARAAAAIFHWKEVPMCSKAQQIGEKIFQGVLEQLGQDRPAWMGPSLRGDQQSIHRDFYPSAIDPSSLDALARLITAAD